MSKRQQDYELRAGVKEALTPLEAKVGMSQPGGSGL